MKLITFQQSTGAPRGGARHLGQAALAAVYLFAAGRLPSAESNTATTMTGLNGQIDAQLAQPRFSGATRAVKAASPDSGRTDVPLDKEYAPLGRLLVRQLASAPFPHPARAGGHRYRDEFFSAQDNYSDSTVAIFVPKNFHPSDKIDFVIHFHGWNNTVAGALKEYQLAAQFCDSGKNAILIVPEGPRNAPDSFGGKLEDTNGFASFMTEVAANLRASGLLARTNFEIGNLILSGHSGGYHVMAAILDHGGLREKIRETWLFDALYGNTENFAAWQKCGGGRLLDIYTDHGGTKEESEKLMADCKKTGTAFFAAEDSAAPDPALETNKLVFLHTGMSHNDVVAKRATFARFLKTSCLENK